MEILLVEDDYLDAMNVQRAFNKLKLQHGLYIARNGKEALEMLHNTHEGNKIPKPDLILLDLNMPKMNGLEFLRELRSDDRFRWTKVFIMTTSDEDSDRDEAKKLGIEGYIVKPLSFDNFDNPQSSMDSFNLLVDLLK